MELSTDQSGNYWLTVHTGSRNFGLRIANYHQDIADQPKRGPLFPPDLPIRERQSWLETHKQNNKKGAGVLFEGEAKQYYEDMRLAQEFAHLNRHTIINTICSALNLTILDSIESVHNYIDFENMILRKGAISAQLGERILIPLNMADGTLICEGKGNKDWNYSAPHGAGRVLSRSKAKNQLTMEQYRLRMANVYSSSINLNTIDEAPMAYKDAGFIERAIDPTAKIIDRLTPVLNIKAS